MKYKKLAADCEEVLFNEITTAAEAERRSMASFIRVACEERANLILTRGEEHAAVTLSD